MAILLALDFIESFMCNNVVIFVDSLSALQAIQGPIYKPSTQLILDIYQKVSYLTKMGISIILEWIPSHVGVMGNEIADRFAKHALSMDTIDINIPLSKSDIKNLSKGILLNMWQNSWDNHDKGRQLYTIVPKVTTHKMLPSTMSRQEERILFKLRSGHFSINKHLHKIGLSDTELCEHCLQVEDIQHYIFECKKYNSQREIMVQKLKENGLTLFTKQILLSGERVSRLPLIEYVKSTTIK